MKSPGDPRPPLLTPALGTDGVVLRGARVLLVRRGHPPFEGRWALPGGFVEVGESTEAASVREVLEETGIPTEVRGLIGVFSEPGRDPRGHVVSAAYLLRPRRGRALRPRGGDDAREARWWRLDALPPLAFDHARILRRALAMARRSSPGARRRGPAPGSGSDGPVDA